MRSLLVASSLLAFAPFALAQDGKLEGRLAEVLDAAEPDELISVTIAMAEQVPREELFALRDVMPKAERREYVKARLKDLARLTQADLLSVLERKVEAGEAARLRPLWIANVIGAKVTPALAREIAAREDVGWVHHDPPRGEEVLAGPVNAPPPALAPTCGLNLINAPDVWSQHGITGNGVVVGVIDTGLCITHPDIANQVWYNPCEIPGNAVDDDNNGFVDDVNGWNFENNNNNISDLHFHGSHVSGTVAGDGTQGTQCGVAPDAEIMTLRFWNSFSGEQTVWDGMQYALDNGADMTTASLGWPHSVGPDRVMWRMVCENTIAGGVVVIYAAGNEGCCCPPDNVRTPGDVPDVITCGAVDCNDNIASFSSCGPITWQGIPPYNDHPYPPGLIKPTVSAPGVSTESHSFCSGYTFASGTSMATPHIAGTAALILQADPTLDHFGVKAILEATAVDKGAPGKDNTYGSGRIDALAAVNMALSNNKFCVAKMNSCGGTPIMSCTGTPSATAPSGFTVTASNVPGGGKVALLVYTDQGPDNIPALGGAICINSFSRSVPVFSTGTQGLCDGTVSIDMNAFRAGSLGGNPKPFLSVPGTTIHTQFWVRDGPNTFGALLTAAYAYTICP